MTEVHLILISNADQKKSPLLLILCLLVGFLNVSCGGGGGGSDETGGCININPGGWCDDDSDDVGDEGDDTINTAKLVGTPFEGLTIGDNFTPYHFICDQYRTDTVQTFPILIFSAFFSESEEEIIQEGISLANQGMGFIAYETTDQWSDDVRVIFKITYTGELNGQARAVFKYFNSHQTAERIASDWAIELAAIAKNTVAHELGHASGIGAHALIDYVNDTIIDLEDGSIMGANGGSALTDYNFMMSTQGQIMAEHLEEEGTLIGFDCDGLKDYYGEEE